MLWNKNDWILISLSDLEGSQLHVPFSDKLTAANVPHSYVIVPRLSTIAHTVDNAISLSCANNDRNVSFEFNGVAMTLNAHSDPQAAFGQYFAAIDKQNTERQAHLPNNPSEAGSSQSKKGYTL